MPDVLREAPTADAVAGLAGRVLGVRPLRVARQTLTSSGNAVYRVYLTGGDSIAFRFSPWPRMFAHTRQNLDELRALGLPVQTVLAAGRTESGGSYVILDWVPGRDLIHELDGMSPAQMSLLAEQVVECQRRLGHLPQSTHFFGWAPIGGNGTYANWTEVFGDTIPPSTADDGTPFGKLRARLCALRNDLQPYLATVRATPFLDDLTTKNILVENGVLTGLIDLDFICYGDPLLAVGATMTSIAADCPESAGYYADELIRFSDPPAARRRTIWFYAALWAVGCLSLSGAAGDPARDQALMRAADKWLRLAERQTR
ncbi:MAG: phosphotransferase [Tepidisphaeraceae bacterium]|jgi:aminoglycoside phosphotransferase (APT) family kinase protein